MKVQLVSVAMATYNGGKYLSQQLDSVVNQTYPIFEIIIVDDNSSDDTIAIIQDYASKFKYIKMYQNGQNLGVVKSFGRALSLCKGKYIALSDQDDVWFPQKIEQLVNNIGDNLLIHSDAVLVNDKLEVMSKSNLSYLKRSKSSFIDYLISPNVTGCTAMCHRELLSLALPIPDGFYIHDYYLSLVASYYNKIKLLYRPLVYYRQHNSNLIGATRPDFDVFIQHCRIKSDSFNTLLNKPIFKDNLDIKLMRDYRLSLHLGKWVSDFSIFRLFVIKHGFYLFVYYLLMAGFKNRNISRKIYNFIYNRK